MNGLPVDKAPTDSELGFSAQDQEKSVSVFYDRSGRRWRWTMALVLTGAALITLFAGLTIFGLFEDRNEDYQAPELSSHIEYIYPYETNAAESAGLHDGSLLYGFVDPTDRNSLASLRHNRARLDGVVVEYGRLSGHGVRRGTVDEDALDAVFRESQGADGVSVLASLAVDYHALSGMLGDRGSLRTASASIRSLLDQFTGVHLDFSTLAASDVHAAVRLTRQLQAGLTAENLVLSVGVPAATPAEVVAAAAHRADQVVLMHDGHGSPRDIDLAKLPAHRIVVALAAFAQESASDGPSWSPNPAPMPIPTALQRARLGGATVEYDENGTASFAYETEGGGRQTVRIFDSVSVFNSLARVQFEGASGSSGPRPLGWALWRLGTETLDVWRVLERRGSLDSSVAHSLRHVVAAPGITYIGAGEAIAYSRDGKDGHRRLDYSGTDGTINASSIEELPSPMTIRRYGAGHERRIALTFDDGPEPPYTPRVLAILKRYGIRATFFVNGLNAIRYPAFLKRIEREGHEIGHHTFSHPNISRISQRRFRLELRSLQVFVESLIGRRMVLFRPPYSEAAEPIEPDEAKPLRLLGQEGYLLVTSHVDPRDWSGKTADEIERHTVELARGEQGHVVLLHDGGGDRTATVEALPAIIEGLRSEGFEIVPLAELLGLERDQVMPRISGQRFVLTRAYRVVFSVAGSVLRVFGILFGVCIAIGLGRAGLMIVLSVAGKLRPRRSARERSVEGVKASVIVPAYNEEKVVTMTVDSILGSTYPDFEILVVDDGSTDDTLGVLTRAYQNHPKVRICSVPNGGKSAALNFGIARSTGEVVVMLDADTVLGRETLGNLIAPFADDSVGAVAGNAKVGNRDKSLTRCQALEYITGQNIEKRAYDVINGISVVPGAVGAWRRSVLVEEGGLAHDTLAEDAELTFRVLRRGYRVVYREDAPGYTEAPDTVRGFVKQRVRWMYGTLQTAWKHRDITFRPRFGALGLVTAPSIYLFQLFFPLFSVIVEIMLLSNAGFHLYQIAHHPTGETASPASLQVLLTFYLLFLGLELAMSLVAFLMEKHERKHLLLWVVVQRFYYRPILSFVALRTLYHILRGRPPGWNKPTRTATVRVDSFAESRGHVQPHEVETPAIIAARRAG